MRNVSRLSLLALSMGLLGCGGGGGGSVAMVPPDAQGAANVIALTVDLTESLQGNDGATLALQVFALGMSGPQQIAMMQAGQAVLVRSAESVPGPNGGSVNCTAVGCIYDQFSSDAGGVFVMDGSVLTSTTAGVAAVTVDLDITLSSGGIDQVWTLSGALDVSPNQIDGALINDGTGNAQNVTYEYYEELTYDAVTISAGEPQSGSIFAKWSRVGQGQTVGAQSTMTF